MNVYLLSGFAPEWLIHMLNLLATTRRSFSGECFDIYIWFCQGFRYFFKNVLWFFLTVSSAATLIALILMTAQCIRRFYETWFISVFSDAKMNLSHYIVGFAHYFGAISSIVVEAPGFTPHAGKKIIHPLDLILWPTMINVFNIYLGVSSLVLKLHLSELHIYHYFAVVTFIWAFIHQYRAAVILGNLRKDPSGKLTHIHVALSCFKVIILHLRR